MAVALCAVGLVAVSCGSDTKQSAATVAPAGTTASAGTTAPAGTAAPAGTSAGTTPAGGTGAGATLKDGDFGEKYHGAIDAVEFCGSMGAQSFREVATLPMPGEAEPEPEPDASDPDTTTDAPAVVLPLRPRRKFWE